MTVFKNENTLAHDFVPPELPGREAHLSATAKLYQYIKGSMRPTNMFIHGPAGSGKTAIARITARNMKIESVYLNCKNLESQAEALTALIQKFDPGFRTRGKGLGEKLKILKQILEKRGKELFVILDEVDKVVDKEEDSLVYALNMINVGQKGPRVVISQCLISAKKTLRELLSPSTLSRFGDRNVLRLRSYTPEQIKKITEYRVELAFFSDCVHDESIEMVIDLANEGDARRVIEILWHAGQAADKEASSDGFDELVMPEHVRAASAYVDTWLSPWEFDEMDAHCLYVLAGAAREVKDVAAVSGEEVRSAYELVCEEHNVKPLGKSMFYANLERLRERDIVRIKKEGRVKRISLFDITARDLDVIMERALKVHRRT